MFLIYNLSGLLVGLGGLLVGFLAFGLTRHLSAALLMIGLFWITFGRAARRAPVLLEESDQTGAPPPAIGMAQVPLPKPQHRGPAPSLFFIPLWVWAIPIILLSIPVFVIDRRSAAANKDPRMARFREDESDLRRYSTTGALAPALRRYLVENATGAELELTDSHVLVNTSPDAVLVLIRIPDLRELNDSVRQKVLDTTTAFLNEHSQSKGKRAFIGLKGSVIYGAIRTPRGTKVDKTVPSELLLDYYSSSGGEESGTSSATKPASAPV